jgi:hypothetical protein
MISFPIDPNRHPLMLDDGRRFATLVCAGNTCHALKGDWTVTDTRNGEVYTKQQAITAYFASRESSPEWREICAPMRAMYDTLGADRRWR